MSDRVAVFNNGRIEQVGTPNEVYERPATPFVAGFVGTSNLLEGSVAAAVLGEIGTFTIRPEKIRMLTRSVVHAADEVAADGAVDHIEYLGPVSRYRIVLDAGSSLLVLAQNTDMGGTDAPPVGARVSLLFRRENARPLTTATSP